VARPPEPDTPSLFPDATPSVPEPAADAPLADRMRPRTLDEVRGQPRLVGPGAPLREWTRRDLGSGSQAVSAPTQREPGETRRESATSQLESTHPTRTECTADDTGRGVELLAELAAQPHLGEAVEGQHAGVDRLTPGRLLGQARDLHVAIGR